MCGVTQRLSMFSSSSKEKNSLKDDAHITRRMTNDDNNFTPHWLMLVYHVQIRGDASIIGLALRDYRDMLAAFSRARRVDLALTHVSSDDYEFGLESEAWDKDVKDHLDQCNEILELSNRCMLLGQLAMDTMWHRNMLEKMRSSKKIAKLRTTTVKLTNVWDPEHTMNICL